MLHRAAVEQPRADKMTMITNAQSDEIFDYQATAELFPGKNARARPRVVKYMRFDHAADAIRFTVEQLPAELLSGAYLEVDEKRYDSRPDCRVRWLPYVHTYPAG
jgi:hypothetical protein